MAINKKNKWFSVCRSIMGLLFFSILFISITYTNPPAFSLKEEPDSSLYLQDDTTRIQIGFVGDIMAHLTQLQAQKIDDSTYDFKNNYIWFIPFFHANDIMIGNLETTFAGKKMKYSAYPLFNTPDELAEALKYAGFDILSTANNHMYDRSTIGLLRTIDVLKKQNILYTGSRQSVEEKRYLIYEVKGIKIGVIAYTYETPRLDDRVTINGILIKDEDVPLINSFNPENLQETTAQMREEYKKMKNEGAEFFITIIHWGDEYKTTPSAYQLALADSMNKLGVDIVFGSHPHVVQPVSYIYNSLTNHNTLVIYSAGNFISNQRYETLKNYNTEDGLYVEIGIEKIAANSLSISNITLHPTWVNRYQNNGKYVYEVVPLTYVLSHDSLKNKFSETQIERMQSSLIRTQTRTKVFYKGY